MPRRNTPAQAVRRYLEPFNTAMHCIEHGTLITSYERVYAVGSEYALVLNSGDPLPLRTLSSPAILLSVAQRFEIVRDDAVEDGPFRVHTRAYWYRFELEDEAELLAFHWTPETQNSQEKRYPHLHIGAALLTADTPLLPGVLHKRHVPTGRVSIESIVRFAIEELGTQPLVPNWNDVLDQGQRRFDRYRRP